MQKFIDRVVLEIQESKSLSDLVFVVPSRRIAVFLKKAIAADITHTIVAPRILTIEDFVIDLSGLQLIDPIELLLVLHKEYNTLRKLNKHMPFDQFLNWAPTVIADFNEIDRYQVDAESTLTNLADIKRLEDWGSDKREGLAYEHILFWDELKSLYDSLAIQLNKREQGYIGQIYRKAADEVAEFLLHNNDVSHHVFMGFSALNKAEEVIFQEFIASDRATVYWDVDQFFMEDKQQEAALFLRDYKKWPVFSNRPFNFIHTEFQKEKNIQIAGASGVIAMSKHVGPIIQGYLDEGIDLSTVAVVLADESILVPVLQAIPQEVLSLNITMGLPLQQASLFSFYKDLIQLLTINNDQGYPYKQVLNILEHGVCKSLVHSKQVAQLRDEILRENIVYIHWEYLSNKLNECEILSFLEPVEVAGELNTRLSDITKAIRTDENMLSALLKEELVHYQTIFNKLQLWLDAHDELNDINVYTKFYNQIVQSETLDFIGDPVEGLQIMGLLETRAIDYEHVIMLSVNEGLMPAGKTFNSFLPYDLKKSIGLPTYYEKDAIFGYHFYRLLFRASEINLVYNTSTEVMGAAEPSRYIRQLLFENLPTHDISHTTVSVPIPQGESQHITIQKSKEAIDILMLYATREDKGFSASALNAYVRDPIDFYLRYVTKAKEPATVDASIAHNVLGTITHDTLEELYTTALQSKESLTLDYLENAKRTAPAVLKSQYAKHYSSQEPQGKNQIIFKVMLRFVMRMIDQDLEDVKSGKEIIITGLENQLNASIELSDGTAIKLHGKADRMDTIDGVQRIIDYKSGKVEQKDITIKSYNDLIEDTKGAKAFQVLMYAYMADQMGLLQSDALPGIFSFKNMNSGYLVFKTHKDFEVPELANRKGINTQVLQGLEQQLKYLLEEIFDQSTPFKANRYDN